MKQQSANAAHQTLWQTSARAWDRFWFTPADPTVLGAIRICCGLITLYTTLAYAFNPDQFIGPHGWMDVEGRLNEIRDKAVTTGPLNWDEIARHRPPVGTEQEKYASYYL